MPLEHLGERLTVEDMARHAHMSYRRLLESTDLPVERVAHSSGFATAAALRIHFERTTATQPTAYRAAFRAA